MFKMDFKSAVSFEERKAAVLEGMRRDHAAAIASMPEGAKAECDVSESDFHMAAELALHAMDEVSRTLQGHVQRGCEVLNGPAAETLFTSNVLRMVNDQVNLIIHDMARQAAAEMLSNLGDVKVISMTMEELEQMLSIEPESKH